VPELPEVETTRAGIAPHVEGKRVRQVIVRDRRLRWPVSAALGRELSGQLIERVRRRGKYLLLETAAGTCIIHLGMSGSLRIVAQDSPAEKHDHVDIVLSSGKSLRLRDPRRFGCVLWTKRDPEKHKLLASLGPEPLSEDFNADYLKDKAGKRKQAIKTFIMNSKVVVGVGNIYANEALFLSGIRPTRPAGRLSKPRMGLLVDSIKQVLGRAIRAGGTTLRDFVNGDGKPGYFSQQLNVYGRGGKPCINCGTALKEIQLGQRATVYCPKCQT
jgi:formamidopyrimidine-DNA glycosylase